MKPSPELDLQVHVHVMGRAAPVPDKPGEWTIVGLIPPYSSSIAAAWEVVQRFKNRVTIEGPDAGVAGGEYHNQEGWRCEIVPDGKRWDDSISVSECESAPHAICLAALKAVGVEA